ncbi:unnamed protein product [Prorocentrum cordatum]|uniref:DNA-directed DNA polymerase n=1 Tax=Prorocentrum cordatum TaxID=2364126 RepID=A0ABN9UAQ8_9DINO|nr:unnamed protein product [Polarella glacialis]
MRGELATVAAGLTQTYLASCPRCPEHRCPDCNCGAPAVRQGAAEVELQFGLPWSWAAANSARAHVLYNGEGELWHQRRRVGSSRACSVTNYILAPDGDCYSEKYDLEEAHISAVRYAFDDAFDRSEALERADHRSREAAAGRDPAAIPPGGYLGQLSVQPAAAAAGAGPLDGAAAVGGLAAGGGARHWRLGGPRRVGVPVGGGAVGGGGEGGVRGDPTLARAAVETRGQRRRGEEVLLPAAAVTLGGAALAPTGDGGSLRLRRLRRQDVMSWIGAEAAGDARILNVDLSDKSSVTDFADWPVVDPRTTEWCMLFLNRRGGGPMDHHRCFAMLRGLETGDWGVDTHRVCLKAVEEAGTYDHLELELRYLASFEVLFRQAQLVEYAREQEKVARQMVGGKGQEGAGKGAGLLGESLVVTGQRREAGGVMLAPELMDFASREVEKDANITKQVREAREERRALTNNKKKDGEGGGLSFAAALVSVSGALRGASEDLDSINLRPSAAQLSCLARIEQAHRELGSPPADLHGQGALEELRRWSGLPCPDVGGSAGVKVLEVLKSLVRAPDDGAAEEERQQLRRAYNDPIFRQKPKEYAKLVRKLHGRGIIEYRRSCKKSAGPFCAWKKGGEQRLILDCRVGNCWFKGAPGVSPATGDSFGRLEIEGAEPVYVSGVDIEVAFYSICLPEGPREHFGMEPVCAGAVGVRWLDGERVHPGVRVVPVLSVLPMGFKGALCVCQALHEAVTERVTGVDADNRLVDGRPAPVVTQGCVHTEYVDNSVALGTDGEEGRRLATEVGAALEADGLGVHPVTCGRGGDALGWHFDELRPARAQYDGSPMASRELNMTWSPKVTVFDASEWGYGMMRESGDKSKDNFEGCLRCPGLSGEAAGGVILEARAGVWALRHILRDSKAVGCRHLVLSDAMAVVLGITKGRTSSRAMARCLRQWAALCLASVAVVHARWISSERSAADGASRGSEERSAAACRDAQPRPERAAAWRPGGCPDGGGFELVDPAVEATPLSSGRRLGSSFPGRSALVKKQASQAPQRARQRRRRASAGSQASASAAAHDRAGASRGVAAAGRRQALPGQELTQLERGTPADADGALVAWLNEQFFEGEPLATGTKMLAALGHLLPGVPRGAPELRRSRRALQGWRRHNPASSRLPLPWPVTAALAKEMLARGQLAAAGATLMAFVLLLRPAEALRLAGGCLVAPVSGGAPNRRKWPVVLHPRERGLTSKVGAQDECMVFDNPEFELVVPMLVSLQRTVAEGRPLFPLRSALWHEAARSAARRLFPSFVAPALYQLRHGGASHEALTEVRSTEGLVRRGRWHSLRSVKRCEKGGRVNQVLRSLTPEELNAALEAERRLGARLSRTYRN